MTGSSEGPKRAVPSTEFQDALRKVLSVSYSKMQDLIEAEKREKLLTASRASCSSK